MTVHLFGAVSSPSCASYALRKTADDNQSDFVSEVTQAVRQNFYVDDCLKSSATEGEAIQMIQDISALSEGGLRVGKMDEQQSHCFASHHRGSKGQGPKRAGFGS